MTLESRPYTTEMIYNPTEDSYTSKGSFSEIFLQLQVKSVTITTNGYQFFWNIFFFFRLD
jgi:hypothetical protein